MIQIDIYHKTHTYHEACLFHSYHIEDFKNKNLKNKTILITQLAGGSHMDGYSLHRRDGGSKTMKGCLPPQQKELVLRT